MFTIANAMNAPKFTNEVEVATSRNIATRPTRPTTTSEPHGVWNVESGVNCPEARAADATKHAVSRASAAAGAAGAAAGVSDAGGALAGGGVGCGAG